MLIGRKPNARGIALANKAVPGAANAIRKLAGRKLSQKQLEKLGLGGKKMELLLNPDWGPVLVKRGKYFVFRDTIGESVRLRHHKHNSSLALKVAFECAKKGASVFAAAGDSATSKQFTKRAMIDVLEDFTPFNKALLENVDVSIYIEDEDDPAWKAGISNLRLSAGMERAKRSHEILDRRKVRWLYVGWPFDKAARKLAMPPKPFEKMIFASLAESFTKRCVGLVEQYFELFQGKDKIRITHEDGTDLSFSIKGRPILKDDGRLSDYSLKTGDVGLNLPSGEVFVAPLETTAQGRVRFPKILAEGHGFTEELWLTFDKGRVVGYEAGKGKNNFDKYLKENTPSTRVLAELGIGCNPAAKYSGYILTDEKIFGTLHLAIGNNTGSYHGKNKASGHLDMVKDMLHGVMYADGKPVMVKGRPENYEKTPK